MNAQQRRVALRKIKPLIGTVMNFRKHSGGLVAVRVLGIVRNAYALGNYEGNYNGARPSTWRVHVVKAKKDLADDSSFNPKIRFLSKA